MKKGFRSYSVVGDAQLYLEMVRFLESKVMVTLFEILLVIGCKRFHLSSIRHARKVGIDKDRKTHDPRQEKTPARPLCQIHNALGYFLGSHSQPFWRSKTFLRPVLTDMLLKLGWRAARVNC